MLLLIGAFLAGILTVFAPCIFALLPVIIGGSMSGDVHDKRRPFIIIISLALSLMAFTLLLKATTLFITVSPEAITYVSGGIIVGIGVLMLFPQLYERLILFFNFQAKSQQLLGKGAGKGAIISAIITGAALGPVFSSCSPVYAYILATVLPVNFGVAIVYMLAYVLGLSAVLLLVGFIGQKFVRKVSWASNPHGAFQRVIAVLFIIVGLLVITGLDKRFQTLIAEKTPFDFDALSSQLIPASNRESAEGVLNVKSYKAPEFTGLEGWINSEPQTVEGLKGKVVLVDFWTYSCINCIRTQPQLKELYSTYKDSGLEIVGIHAPEFAFEKNIDNVRSAVKKAALPYPIALDNNFSTWNAYQNQYWPASYLIDQEGNVRRTHFGEGGFKETEQAIRMLLEEKGAKLPTASMGQSADVPVVDGQTPETYLGTKKASNYRGTPGLSQGVRIFTPEAITTNDWTLSGEWRITSEGIVASKDSRILIKIAAKDMYLVTANDMPGTLTVMLNGKPISQTGAAGSDVVDSKVNVSRGQLYSIVSQKDFSKDDVVELQVSSGVQLNTFTFGGK